MKASLKPGLEFTHRFTVTEAKTVPALYPESAEFSSMPQVFATGFMVGLMEWACIELMAPHLEPGFGSLGTHIDVSHDAATPVGFEITVTAKLVAVDGRKLTFTVEGHDGQDSIGRGTHQRTVVRWESFQAKVAEKAAAST